jgi:hypothetical protein
VVTTFKIGKNAVGQRGKYAEGKVKDFLTKHAASKVDFDWERLPDARSAMGRMKAQIADYSFFMPGVHGVIEVKEVEHDVRLPAKNFGDDQIAKMYKRQLAGGVPVVLVYHKTTGLWRCPDYNWMREERAASWNLSDWSTFTTAQQALETVHYLGEFLFR